MQMMRWGFPSPPFSARRPVTNIRNLDSGYWKPYLIKRAHRCLVPVTSFSETDNSVIPTRLTWFAQDKTRPLFFFAGIWREWEADRGTKASPDVGKPLLFSCVTTGISADAALVHDKATPVCLFDKAAREDWMTAPFELARQQQRPTRPGSLRVVATDTKQDG
jgi:putative SOS response-associated peptidase YedK